jgi:hypothetical protein
VRGLGAPDGFVAGVFLEREKYPKPFLGTVDGPVPLCICCTSTVGHDFDVYLRRSASVGEHLTTAGSDAAGIEQNDVLVAYNNSILHAICIVVELESARGLGEFHHALIGDILACSMFH